MSGYRNERYVAVCGGRKYADREHVFSTLDALHGAHLVDWLVHGGATGADALAAEWARARGVNEYVFAANWLVEGRSAGPKRNQRMVDHGRLNLVVAFPGGKGTADMVRRSRAKGIAVLRATPPGLLEAVP